jgi:hypothetical protein
MNKARTICLIIAVTAVFGLQFSIFNVVSAASEPSDPDYFKLWYLRQIQADKVWDKAANGKDVVVAVIDAGINIDHPDLRNKIWKNPYEILDGKDNDGNGYIDDINGWDFVDNTNNPRPRVDMEWNAAGVHHGTLVAGIIAAEMNNNIASVGVASHAKIMPLRVLNSIGVGDTKAVADAIDYAVRNKAKIINLSFVGTEKSKILEDALARAYKAGVIIVAAAGNDSAHLEGADLDQTPAYPVCYDGAPGENWVIGVAATDPLDQKTTFSSFGKSCIDVAAPGLGIWGLATQDARYDLKDLSRGYWSGTSMSAPQVSGLAAMVWSIRPDLTASEVKDAILQNSDSIDDVNPLYKGKLGLGRINAKRTVSYVLGEDVTGRILRLSSPHIITASLAGVNPKVKVISNDSKEVLKLNPFSKWYNQEVSVAFGDINRDGKDEIIVGAGKNALPTIKIYDLGGNLIKEFLAFEKSYSGGVEVAVGDVDADMFLDIVATRANWGAPEIKVFNNKYEEVGNFLVFPKRFTAGLRLAIGDINGDSVKEIIITPRVGNPDIVAFRVDGLKVADFSAYGNSYRNGLSITAGDFDGDGIDEIVSCTTSGREAEIKIFNNQGELLNNLIPLPRYKKGFYVSYVKWGDKKQPSLVLSPSGGGLGAIYVLDTNGVMLWGFSLNKEDIKYGVKVLGVGY